MARRRTSPRDDDRPVPPRQRPRREPRGCSITTILAVLIVLVLGMIGVVGYMYLKDSGWVTNRNIQLDNKLKKASGLASRIPFLESLFSKKTNDGQPVEKQSLQDKAGELVSKAVDDSGLVKKTVPEKKSEPAPVVKKTAEKQAVSKAPAATVKKKAAAVSTKTVQTVKKTAATVKKNPAVVDQPKPRDVLIYFIQYNSASEAVTLSAVKRRLQATDKPLEDTIKTLLKDTTDAEEASQYSSAIPYGVAVRSVSVANGVATIDLSANFESGTGKKMMQARVYQVVYTATQYPTVKKVQILLNGKKDEDFGGEGIDLTRPLGRLSSASPQF